MPQDTVGLPDITQENLHRTSAEPLLVVIEPESVVDIATDDQLEVGVLLAQVAGEVDARGARHADVEDDDVGLQPLHRFGRLGGV